MANYMQSATVTCNVAASPGTAVYTCTLPTTDTYTIQGTLQLPKSDPVPSAYSSNAGAGGGTNTGTQSQSAVVLVVKNGSTTIYTSAAGDRGFVTTNSATAGDVITISLYSSSTPDEQVNACQLTVAISEGVI